MSEIVSKEHDEQVGFVDWIRIKYPSLLVFSIPNGEYRAISVAKRLKAEGLTPGIPDLFIPKWKCFVEMKRVKGGSLSKEQEEIIRYLTRVGYYVIVGYGAEDASRKIMIMVKERGL